MKICLILASLAIVFALSGVTGSILPQEAENEVAPQEEAAIEVNEDDDQAPMEAMDGEAMKRKAEAVDEEAKEVEHEAKDVSKEVEELEKDVNEAAAAKDNGPSESGFWATIKGALKKLHNKVTGTLKKVFSSEKDKDKKQEAKEVAQEADSVEEEAEEVEKLAEDAEKHAKAHKGGIWGRLTGAFHSVVAKAKKTIKTVTDTVKSYAGLTKKG